MQSSDSAPLVVGSRTGACERPGNRRGAAGTATRSRGSRAAPVTSSLSPSRIGVAARSLRETAGKVARKTPPSTSAAVDLFEDPVDVGVLGARDRVHRHGHVQAAAEWLEVAKITAPELDRLAGKAVRARLPGWRAHSRRRSPVRNVRRGKRAPRPSRSPGRRRSSVGGSGSAAEPLRPPRAAGRTVDRTLRCEAAARPSLQVPRAMCPALLCQFVPSVANLGSAPSRIQRIAMHIPYEEDARRSSYFWRLARKSALAGVVPRRSVKQLHRLGGLQRSERATQQRDLLVLVGR